MSTMIRGSIIAEEVQRVLRAAGLFDRFREPPAHVEALRLAADGLTGARRLTWDPRAQRAALVPVSPRQSALVLARDLSIESLYEFAPPRIWVGQLSGDHTILEVFSEPLEEPLDLDGLWVQSAPDAVESASASASASRAVRWVWPDSWRIIENPAVVILESKAGSTELQLCGVGRPPLVAVRLTSPVVSAPAAVAVALRLVTSSDGVHSVSAESVELGNGAIIVRSDGQLQDILRMLAQTACS